MSVFYNFTVQVLKSSILLTSISQPCFSFPSSLSIFNIIKDFFRSHGAFFVFGTVATQNLHLSLLRHYTHLLLYKDLTSKFISPFLSLVPSLKYTLAEPSR